MSRELKAIDQDATDKESSIVRIDSGTASPNSERRQFFVDPRIDWSLACEFMKKQHELMVELIRSNIKQADLHNDIQEKRVEKCQDFLYKLRGDIKEVQERKLKLKADQINIQKLLSDQRQKIAQLQERLVKAEESAQQLMHVRSHLAQLSDRIDIIKKDILSVPKLQESTGGLSRNMEGVNDKLQRLPLLQQSVTTLNTQMAQLQSNTDGKIADIKKKLSEMPDKAAITAVQKKLGDFNALCSGEVQADVKLFSEKSSALQRDLDKAVTQRNGVETRITAGEAAMTLWANNHVHGHGRFTGVVCVQLGERHGKIYWDETGRVAATAQPTTQLKF